MGKKMHYVGSKKRGSHTSVIFQAWELIKSLEKLEIVTGIAPSLIDATVKSKVPRFKNKIIPIGVELKVYSKASMQIILLYTGSPEKLDQIIKQYHLEK